MLVFVRVFLLPSDCLAFAAVLPLEPAGFGFIGAPCKAKADAKEAFTGKLLLAIV